MSNTLDELRQNGTTVIDGSAQIAEVRANVDCFARDEQRKKTEIANGTPYFLRSDVRKNLIPILALMAVAAGTAAVKSCEPPHLPSVQQER